MKGRWEPYHTQSKYRSQNLVVDTGGFKPGALQFRTRTKCLTYCANYQMIILPNNIPHLIIQFLFYKQLLFHISLSCSGQNYGSTRKVPKFQLKFFMNSARLCHRRQYFNDIMMSKLKC